jgi:hypothetical protein
VVGARAPSRRLYFAEGCTHSWADEWLCIQNPGGTDANVELTFQVAGETGFSRTVPVSGASRCTVDVKAEVGQGKDVSVALESDQPVVAERPMYFNYQERWPGGHDVMGADCPSEQIYFAEGTTRYNPNDGYFEEWVCIQNPGTDAAEVTVSFMKTNGTEVPYEFTLAAGDRKTLSANEILGENVDAAMVINSNRAVVAERPMYFDYHGFAVGGHDTTGYGI